MPAYAIAHANKDETADCPEIVGSKDLRESFKERGRLRGSFSINGYEFHQFESNGIDNLLALLNAGSASTHVKASIDDGYHLVLEANSPAPISIRAGEAFVEPPPAAGTVVVAAKEEDGKPKNTILEDLGLTATDDAEAPAVGAVPPGPSAAERKKAREEAAGSARPGDVPAAAETPVAPAAEPVGHDPAAHAPHRPKPSHR